MFQQQCKEDPEKCGSEVASLFDSTKDAEGLRSAAIELHSSFHVGVEGLDHALEFWRAADL